MNWLDICALDEINPLGSRVVAGPKGDIAIFRAADDQVFALDDRCPHKGGPLSQGLIYGKRVACPLHNWQIELESGEAVAPTRAAPIATRCGWRTGGCCSAWTAWRCAPDLSPITGAEHVDRFPAAHHRFDLLLLRRGLWRPDRTRRRTHPRRARRSSAPGQLRQTLQQRRQPAPDRRPPGPRAVPPTAPRQATRARSDWESALEHAAGRFAETIREHGPDSVAFYISGQLLTEDYYAFNKLARALVGTNNIDSNSRLCMSSAVVGYKRSLRRRTAVQLRRPRLRRLRADRRQQHGLRPPGPVPSPGSRQGRSAGDAHRGDRPAAHRHLRAGRPAPGAAARYRRRTVPRHPAYPALGGLDRPFVHRRAYRGFRRPEGTGARLHPGRRRRHLRHRPRRPAALRRMDRPFAALPFALVHGAQPVQRRQRQEQRTDQPAPGHRQDRPRRMRAVFLTGQPNAMGGRETGSLANLLPGHREAADPGHRAEVAHYWGVEQLPTSPVSAPSSCSMRSTTAGSRRSGSPVPTPRNRCRTSARSTRPLPAVPSWWSRKPSPARKPANTPTFCFQPHPGEKRKAP